MGRYAGGTSQAGKVKAKAWKGKELGVEYVRKREGRQGRHERGGQRQLVGAPKGSRGGLCNLF